jgi:opacity protein-like surface antigen
MYIHRFVIAACSILSTSYLREALAEPSPIGDAATVQNQVDGIVNRKAELISPGGSVFQNERVHTGDESQTQLVFLDHTHFAIGPRSEATIDRFIYNPDRGTGRVQIEASRGVFRFVTGSQNKKDYEVVTPSGTIRVTGTEFHLLVERGYIIVALAEGALNITTNKGRVVVLDKPGTRVTIHSDGRVDGPTPWSGPITEYAGAPFPFFVGSVLQAETGAPIRWTGFYGSLEGGYAWDGSIVYVGPWNKGFGDNGVFGGANVGFNYQIGSFVIGAQAQYDFANASGSASTFPYNVHANIDGFGSIDARAGVPFGSALIYAIGGFSYGDIRHTVTQVQSFESSSSSAWQTGWDIGVGVEYKFTDNLSGFAEFRKYNWGAKNAADNVFFANSIKQTLDVARVGLTYHLGGPFFGASY